MTPERLFSLANLVAMVGWLPMIFFPRKRWASSVVPIVIPALLAIIYVALIVSAMTGSDGGYSSLGAVKALFEDPWLLLAGWVHYLAFDLFVGGWVVRDAQKRGVPHLLVVPTLVLTFLFGPGGLLLYLAIRSLARQRATLAAAVVE